MSDETDKPAVTGEAEAAVVADPTLNSEGKKLPVEIFTDHSVVEDRLFEKKRGNGNMEDAFDDTDYSAAMEAARKDPKVKLVEPLREGGFKVGY